MENIQIINNKQFNGVEIYFNQKPNQNIITELKNKHFKWHTAKKCWYNKATEEAKKFIETLTGGEPITASEEEPRKKTNAKENPQSKYKYNYNNIITEDGEKIKTRYHIDPLTQEIILYLDTYKILQNTPNGTYQKNDSDIMTDYFEETTLYIKPQSKEYLNALDGYRKQYEHETKMNDKRALTHKYITATTEEEKARANAIFDKAEELARNFVTMTEANATQIYNNFITEQKEQEEKRQEEERIENIRVDIKNLQENKTALANGKYSYYSAIYENSDFIASTNEHFYILYDFGENHGKRQYEIDVNIIDKNNLIATRKKFTNKEQASKFLKNYKLA